MLNGGTRFELTCVHCGIRLLVVDRIRDAQARAMANHVRERHPELGLAKTATMGPMLDHYRVRSAQ